MKNNLLFSQTTALSKTLGKRLVMVLTMLLIVGIGQAWGAEVTFNKNDFSSSDKTETKGDITLTFDAVTINNQQIRFNSNNRMIVTSSSGSITRIDVTTNSTETYISPLGNTVSSGSWSKNTATKYYWAGNASSVTLTPNAAIRITEVKVTYGETSSGDDDDDSSDNLGGTYTIVFATGDNTTATTSSVQLSTMIADGTENVVSFSIDATDKYVYHKGAGVSNATGSGLRLGKSGGKGKITFNLSEQISSQCLSSISVTTSAWDANTTVSLLVNGENSTISTALAGNTISYTPQNPLTNLSSITLYANARAFIKTITIETTTCTTETTVCLVHKYGRARYGLVPDGNGVLTVW